MDDAELRERLAAEHPAAFGWALACCRGDRDEASDLLQQVYLAVLEGRASFGGRSTFRTWLFGVIRLTALSRRRKEWWRSLLLVKLEQMGNTGRWEAENPRADIELEDEAARIRLALRQLSTRQQEVLHLVFYQEMTVEGAAEVMKVSVGSARTHYHRGKARLAELLREGGEK